MKLQESSDKISSQLRALTAESAGAKALEADKAKMASLALDMGTGECKLLVLLHEGDGVIVLKELATSKDVQERDKEVSGDVHKTVDIAMSYMDQLGHKTTRRKTIDRSSPPLGALGISPGISEADKKPLASNVHEEVLL